MTLQEKIKEALSYLAKQDLVGMEPGKYIVNDDFFYLIQEYPSKQPEICRPETHTKYVDIQMVLSGLEAIEVWDVERAVSTIPYNEEKDIAFYEVKDDSQRMVLSAGSYVILYPENVHRPGLAVGESVPVKKCVAKIRI